ncbi:hypothetical protein GUJ93_ZPchr0458g22654 [Zizania palustris]|uniref:dolichyl-diphosphooligosaccharide--protein glycotransferase n=1 Tax=Zizania palustris TaxID=103762 RepID=A0A8J5RDS9_ZIZPA|nr:hypothetical protein GUJ93_ZPchr0458g22654 [Zizania palustris]
MAATVLDSLPASLRSLRLKTKQQELLLRVSALALIYVLAFAVRLFSVLRYESMIHEFDPYFNYRTTLFLSEHGFSEFWNWFDSESWYPLGRVVGGTLFPGLMVTAALLHRLLRALSLAVHIREVCVLTAPFFAANTTLVAYAFGREIWDSGAGLVAAALIAICPGYISRSVAGSYDNEGVAIFALLLTFYLFVRAVNTGSLAWALASAFGYFYMVSAWGGYVFIINLLPLYVLVLLVTGRYSQRLYVAYNCTYVLGMLLAMQIRFVGFQHVQSGEHMAAMGVFFLLQVFFFLDWVKYLLNDARLFKSFLRITLTCVITVGALALGIGTASGLYFCFKRLSDATIFIVMYGLTTTIKNLTTLIRTKSKSPQTASGKATGSKAAAKVAVDQSLPFQHNAAIALLLGAFYLLSRYAMTLISSYGWCVLVEEFSPVIKEPDYLVNGEYRVAKGAAPKMLNCLMYKLCYYRFGELTTEYGKPPGYDRVRGVEIGNKDIKLEYLEEAFTTSNWIVRIYKIRMTERGSTGGV